LADKAAEFQQKLTFFPGFKVAAGRASKVGCKIKEFSENLLAGQFPQRKCTQVGLTG